ncbi:MAG TPA: hypothetical protein PLU22_03070 [Polyangiaceae bacterium]|nr:hypothetical protein [Polyangiaceae bacterium]
MPRCAPFVPGRPRFLLGGALLGLSVLFGGAGCAARREAAEQQLRALEDQVDLLENANDRLEARVGALELAARRAGKGTAAGASRRDGADRPALDVVKLGPASEPPPAEPPPEPGSAPSPRPPGAAPDDAPRLLIQGSGDRIETREPAPTSALGPPGRTPRAPGVGVRQDEPAVRRPPAFAPARRA